MEDKGGFFLQVKFSEPEGVPIAFTNLFLIQTPGDNFVLNFAQLAPFLEGTIEEQRRQVEQTGPTVVKPFVRVGLSRGGAEQLFTQLGTALGFISPGEVPHATTDQRDSANP